MERTSWKRSSDRAKHVFWIAATTNIPNAYIAEPEVLNISQIYVSRHSVQVFPQLDNQYAGLQSKLCWTHVFHHFEGDHSAISTFNISQWWNWYIIFLYPNNIMHNIKFHNILIILCRDNFEEKKYI